MYFYELGLQKSESNGDGLSYLFKNNILSKYLLILFVSDMQEHRCLTGRVQQGKSGTACMAFS
ncbi:hypothetical protein J8532_004586 [Escherichia coli]|nr:hypothetical protein [Escherichia coli]HAV8125596.1 hypothetical protein [Escherichia coli]